MKLFRAIGNPYFSFSSSLFLAAILYSPKISGVFPDFGIAIFLLLSTSIFAGYFLGTISQRKVAQIIESPFKIKKAYSTTIFILTLPLAILEIIIDPNTPLAMAISGSGTHKSFVVEYGLPTIHAIVVTLFQIVIVQGCNELIEKIEGRKRVILSIIGATFFLIIFLSRGALVICLIASVFCYLSSTKSYRKKRVGTTILAVALALYIFGWLGNLRTGDDEYILKVGAANTNIFGEIIPSEFFWSYLYITSPLANLALSIEANESLQHFDLGTVILLDMVPDVISKRITESNEEWTAFRPLIDPALTVGTAFARPYFFGGAIGAIMVLLWTLVLIYISISTPKSNPYATTILGFTNALAFLCVFTNTSVFSGTVGPIYICLALGIIKRLKWGKKKSNE